jgi:Neuraminidase (sialidase)
MLLGFQLNAQFKNVTIPVPKKATYAYSQVEPSICINPKNTDEIIAGTVLTDFYYSKDGGHTWKAKTLKAKWGVYGDPCVIVDTLENFYFFHLTNPNDKRLTGGIGVQRSNKVKGKFRMKSHTAVNGKYHDKEWAAVNPKNNEIYMTWTQFDAYDSKDPADLSHIVFSKSNDQGETWSSPKIISAVPGDCQDDDYTAEGAVPTVGADGEIFVSWARNDSLWFNKSLDGGETWLDEETFVGNQVAGWNLDIIGLSRANGMPITSCDLSDSRDKGTIYVNWSDQRNGIVDTDIWIKKSTDQGNTWSDPIRVNQDTTKSQQFLSWMTIDQTSGYVYVLYYSRAAYKDFRTDVVLAVSKDGGENFKEYTVSEESFAPNPKVFFGDYINISVHDGVIRPIWMRLDQGAISLKTAIIHQNNLK